MFSSKEKKEFKPGFYPKPKTNRKINNKTFKNKKLINIPTDFIKYHQKRNEKLPNAWAGWVIFFSVLFSSRVSQFFHFFSKNNNS